MLTKVTNITAGKTLNNKWQPFLEVTNRWNGAKNCGGISSLYSTNNNINTGTNDVNRSNNISTYNIIRSSIYNNIIISTSTTNNIFIISSSCGII